MLQYDGGRQTPLWQLAVEYERARGNFSEAEVLSKMTDIVRILRKSIQSGLAGTHYEDRVLGSQSGRFQELMNRGGLLDGGALNQIVLYVTAMMEVKSSMGVIVAAPTAGACTARVAEGARPSGRCATGTRRWTPAAARPPPSAAARRRSR